MRKAGVFGFASRTRWRQNRLLILGYHGIAQHDEHRWDPALFMTSRLLESRLYTLRATGFNILPLSDALGRLKAGTLPNRSVSITFDDGYVDFHRLAAPVLKAYNAPATVYLTTYYAEKGLPIPGITAAYMIWMSPRFAGPLQTLPGHEAIDFGNDEQRREVSRAVGEFFTYNRTLSTADKHALLERLAAELQFDLAALQQQRLMHLMSPDEVREVAAMGFDIQLHTHTHQVPRNESAIRREINENRERIEAMTRRPARHFCYPSGVYYPELVTWLRGMQVDSATTCLPGLASPGRDPLLLPRFVDHSRVTEVEFEAWATGVGAVLPRRPVPELAIP